jgi:putative transposase
MGRGKYSSEQILAILKEQEAGTPVADLCRTYGMHQETFYAWKRKYTGMQGGDVQKLRQLSEENARLGALLKHQRLDPTPVEAKRQGQTYWTGPRDNNGRAKSPHGDLDGINGKADRKQHRHGSRHLHCPVRYQSDAMP